MKRCIDEKIELLSGYASFPESAINNCADAGKELLEKIKNKNPKQITQAYQTFNTYRRNYEIFYPSTSLEEIKKLVQQEYNDYKKKSIKSLRNKE